MSERATSAIEWQFRRDESGRLTRLILPGGKETLFSYECFPDARQRVKRVTRSFFGGEVCYEYDRRGRRNALIDQTGSTHFEWDPLGQLTRVRRSMGGELEYRYDTLCRLKGYRLGSDFDVEYEYDFLGRIDAIKTPVGTVRYEYWTGQDKTIRILPNGMRSIWDCEPDGQLAAITHVDSTDHVIAKFSYGYRPDGLIEHLLEWSPRGEKKLSFRYDPGQRLAAVSDSSGKSWQSDYDGFGNRTKESSSDGAAIDYRHDWAGRLMSVNGAACEHDDFGNLSSVNVGGRLRQFEFDHDNRICGANQGEVRYEHDGDGNLVARTWRRERTIYVPDPLSDDWRPLVELTPGGGRRFYLWDAHGLLAIVDDGASTYFLPDHLGSARCLVDRSGNVFERRDYSAFGIFEVQSNGSNLAPGFAGLFWDSVACAYLTRTRAYSPELGRFLQIAFSPNVPTGSQKSLPGYVYCGNDPVNYADTTGLCPKRITMARSI